MFLGACTAGAQEHSESDTSWRLRAVLRAAGGDHERPDTLRVQASLTNEWEIAREVEHGACPVRLHAFRTASREGPPVWRSEHRAPWEGGYEYACPLSLVLGEVDPGETYAPDEFSLSVPVTEILGDSLPDGGYHFVVLVDADSTTFWHSAGAAELHLERPPLRSRRVVGLLTYQAETLVSRTGPAIIRAEVTAQLTHAGTSTLRFSADCPVLLYAYRTRERRDEAPLSGEPAWRGPRECRDEMRAVELVRNQEVAFAIEASAADILGPSGQPGRYFFAVVVQLEGRRVYLSAGEAELRR